MRKGFLWSLVAAFLAVPLAASLSFASWFSHNSTSKTASIDIANPTRVGKYTLQAGTYKIQFPTNTQSPKVKFMRDGKVVASVPARVSSQSSKNEYTSVEVNTQGKTSVINKIEPEGLNESLVFTQNAAWRKSS